MAGLITIYFVRHGEVHNPTGIIYGRLPGFGLSASGRAQIERAAGILTERGPFNALYASPLQRAQESGEILADRLGLTLETEERLVETGIGGYQGQMFEALPRPYITEEAVHEGLESARSIRGRILSWTDAMQKNRSGQRLIAVSHRDPIIVALLHWMNRGLEMLSDFDLATGGVYEVRLDGAEAQVDRVV